MPIDQTISIYATPPGPGSGAMEANPSPSTLPSGGELAALLEELEFFSSASETPYCERRRSGSDDGAAEERSVQRVRIRSPQFLEMISLIIFRRTGLLTKSSQLRSIQMIAAAMALENVRMEEDPDDLLLFILRELIGTKNVYKVATTVLLQQINKMGSHDFNWADPPDAIPKNAVSLGRRLKAMKAQLRAVGIEHVVRHQSTSNMNIFKQCDLPSVEASTVVATTPSDLPADQAE